MKNVDIINKLGGELNVAHKLSKHQLTIARWKKDGIPVKYWKKIIALSKGEVTFKTLFNASFK